MADAYDNYLYYKRENNTYKIEVTNLIKKHKKEEYNDKIFLLLDEIN
jgi:hypothetical protein